MPYICRDYLSSQQAKSLPVHKMANMGQPELMNGECYYLLLIAEEIEKAYRPSDTFQNESINDVNRKFRFKYGPIFSDYYLKSRFKQLNKKYHEFSELLSHDGVTWDSGHNILRGDHNLLREKNYKYCQVHDGYTGGEANFDYMCRIFESGVQFEF